MKKNVSVEREFGVPIPGKVLERSLWTQTALKKLPAEGPRPRLPDRDGRRVASPGRVELDRHRRPDVQPREDSGEPPYHGNVVRAADEDAASGAVRCQGGTRRRRGRRDRQRVGVPRSLLFEPCKL